MKKHNTFILLLAALIRFGTSAITQTGWAADTANLAKAAQKSPNGKLR